MKKLMFMVCCAVAFSGCTCEEKPQPEAEPEAKPVPEVTKVSPKNLKINTKQLQLSLEALEKYKKELAKKRAQHQALLEAAGTDVKLPVDSDAEADGSAEKADANEKPESKGGKPDAEKDAETKPEK